MASIEIMNVDKLFGNVQVLYDVSISIADKEFVVLVGPSGCGKSTLLRMIAGLESVTSGSIELGGKNLAGMAPRQRDVAMVFQNYALYPHMTVRENMGFSLRLKNVDRKARDARVNEVAEILGLVPFLDRYPKNLSGGQRQRVGMGRAIVRQPQAFLFDEPLSNLDAKLRVQMRTEIKQLHRRLQTTSVYVTHDQIEAMTLADRVIIMDEGVIRQIGRPLDLYDRPADKFVASFIGSPQMNFFDARVQREDNNVRGITKEGLELALDHAAPVSDGDEIVCGVRPEDVTFERAEGMDSEVDAELLVLEPTGPDTLLICQLRDREIEILSRERVDVVAGDRLRIGASPTKVHLFDKSNGKRLNDRRETSAK